MTNPTFSVVIPVYNEEESVRPLLLSLQSVMESLGQPYEMIVVDDGSTDGAADVIERYRDRIVYVRRGNRGLAATRASLAKLGFKEQPGSPHDFATLIATDVERWAAVVALTGAKGD